MNNKNFLKGALVLTVGALICKVLGAIYRIPLANILGDEGLGVYQLIYPVYAFSIVYVTSGITNAIAFLVSQDKKTYKIREVKKYFYSGLVISSLICLLIAISFVVFSNNIANILGNSQSRLGIIVAGISVLFSGLISSYRGLYQGFEDMTPTAISQILEQIFKVGFGIWFTILFVKNGSSMAVMGAFLGVLVGEIVASIYFLFFQMFNKNRYPEISKSNKKIKFFDATRAVLKKSLGFGITGLIIPLTVAVDSFLVVNLLNKSGLNSNVSTALFGVMSGMVNSLINFPMILAVALSTSIIPTISFLVKRKQKRAVEDKVNTAIKLVLYLSFPCAIGLMIVANNVISIFYPTLDFAMKNVAVRLLLISSFNIIYLGLLQITSSILQALGRNYLPVINSFLGCLLKILITIVLVPISSINIYGSAIAGVVAYLLPSVLNIVFLRRIINVNIGAKKTFGIVVAGAIMAGATITINLLLTNRVGNLLSLIICVIVAVLIYFSITLAFGTISKKELFNKLEKS